MDTPARPELPVSLSRPLLDHAADLIRAARRPERAPHPCIVRWPYKHTYPRFEVSPPAGDPDICPYCGHEHPAEEAPS